MQHDTKKSTSSDSRPKRRRRRSSQNSKSNSPENVSGVLEKPSTLDKATATPADTQLPLSVDEVEEMKSHLRFLFKNRKRLQLKINAKEDLLLNGSRLPSERGVCMHLLGKVDRPCVETALSRISSPENRTTLLEGVVRFSSDVGILVLYLESLKASTSRQEAAAALSTGLQRIDFDKATKSQMATVLELILALFPEPDLPQLLFSLLRSKSFRDAFDHTSDRLPPPLGDIFVPLREVFAVVAEDQPTEYQALFKRGLNLILNSAKDSLASYPPTMRTRFFEYAIHFSEKPSETDPTLQKIMDSFPPKSRQFSNLGMLWVQQLLHRHNDSKAVRILNQVITHHPDFNLPQKWLKALKQKRLGRIALTDTDAGRERRQGFWLDEQQSVVVLIASPTEQTSLEPQAMIHSSLVAPGIVPFILWDHSPTKEAFIVVENIGRSAAQCYQRRAPRNTVVSHLREGVALLSMLGQLGITLPDLNLQRCVVDGNGRLWLEDLRGAKRLPPEEALALNLCVARQWFHTHLKHLHSNRPPSLNQDRLEAAPTFEALFSLNTKLP